MGLIKCADCGNQVSDRAESCPQCGCPISVSIDQESKKYDLQNQQIKDIQENFICWKCKHTEFRFIRNLTVQTLEAKCLNCGAYTEVCRNYDRDALPDTPNISLPVERSDFNFSPSIECPYCHSNNTKKISGTSRAVSFFTLGLASKKVGKQWHCKNCGSDF